MDCLCCQGGGRGWAAKESPRVIAGTVQQLVERLTYHRVIGTFGNTAVQITAYIIMFITPQLLAILTDSEFTEVFMLTFYSFMTPHQLMSTLVKRYRT